MFLPFKRKSYGLFSSCCNDWIILQPPKELAQLPVGLLKRGRAAQEPQEGNHISPGLCCWAPGSYLALSCNLTCSKVFPVQEKLPWSFDNQSWKGRKFRQGGIGKSLYIEIIWIWPDFLGRPWRLRHTRSLFSFFLTQYFKIKILRCLPIKEFFKCAWLVLKGLPGRVGELEAESPLCTSCFTPGSEPRLFPDSLGQTPH